MNYVIIRLSSLHHIEDLALDFINSDVRQMRDMAEQVEIFRAILEDAVEMVASEAGISERSWDLQRLDHTPSTSDHRRNTGGV